MRLIDADALAREMYHKSFEVDDGRNVWNSGLWIRYKIFEEAIRDAPIIDAVPVRHGKWVHLGGDEWCCSACGEIECTEGSWEHPLKDRGWKYCRTCGARMDEEKEE